MEEDIIQLRKLIQDLKLYWLDEELDEIISAGKQQSKQIKEGKNKTYSGIEQIEFTDKEQLELIITALKNYFVILPKIQNDTAKVIFDILKLSKITFGEREISEQTNLDNDTQNLDRLLNQIGER